MALLEPIHWEGVTPQMRELLRFIGQQTFAERFFLAGGTALALRLGHRYSIDLDFFSATDEVLQVTRQKIVHGLSPFSPQVLEDVDGNLLLSASGLHVGFFGYGYILLEATNSVEGVALASVVDIGLMSPFGWDYPERFGHKTERITPGLVLAQLFDHAEAVVARARSKMRKVFQITLHDLSCDLRLVQVFFNQKAVEVS